MQATPETYRPDGSVQRRSAARLHLDRWPPLVGRTMIAALFLIAGFAKIADFEGTVGYMQAQGMPPAYSILRATMGLLAVLAIIIEVGCGLALLLGVWTRFSALLLALYLIPVTLIFHPFWAYTGPALLEQMLHFAKNLAIMGGLAYAAAYGAGRFGLEARRHRNALREPRPVAKPFARQPVGT